MNENKLSTINSPTERRIDSAVMKTSLSMYVAESVVTDGVLLEASSMSATYGAYTFFFTSFFSVFIGLLFNFSTFINGPFTEPDSSSSCSSPESLLLQRVHFKMTSKSRKLSSGQKKLHWALRSYRTFSVLAVQVADYEVWCSLCFFEGYVADSRLQSFQFFDEHSTHDLSCIISSCFDVVLRPILPDGLTSFDSRNHA